MELWVKIRNKVIGWKYRYILKPVLFLFDPELVHDFFVATGAFLGSNFISRWLVSFWLYYENPILEQEILGLKFKNPVGLSAGFDKNARLTKIMPEVGFGFMEVGSVTGEPCIGNPKPRLWRLIKEKSLVVYYGLKNDGAEVIAQKLKDKSSKIPLGINIAKTNNQKTITTEEGVKDYLKAYQAFLNTHVGDYFTINISCPNTFGGEPFTDPEKLDKLLSALRGPASQWDKPVFIKMPSDLSEQQIDKIIELAKKYKLSGFVCTNLAKNPNHKGGVSGKQVKELSTKQIKYIYHQTRGEFVIIGCGGIFTAQDAYTKIKAGASLLQMITGMIFEGPQVISEINQGLTVLLKQNGYKNIREAIGKGAI